MRAQVMLLLMHYSYLAVFLLIMLEDFGLPAPGETALIVASVAAAAGKLNIWGVLGAAFLGALIGDNIGWAIGHWGGRKLVISVGSKVGITDERYERAEGFFSRFGDVIVVGARFVEGLRQLNGIIAGTMGMHWATFIGYNALGAALWVGVWGAVGYFAGEHIRQIEHWLLRFSWLGLLIALAAAIWWISTHRPQPAPSDGV
jgi:membrane protein DedA with SNARE-associated domain